MRLRLKALVVVLLVSLFVAVMIPCVYSRYIRGETLYYISKVDNFRTGISLRIGSNVAARYGAESAPSTSSMIGLKCEDMTS